MDPMDSAWRVLKQRFEQCPECDAELKHGNCTFCGWKRPLEGQIAGRDTNSLRALMPGGGPIADCPKCGGSTILETPIGSGDLSCLSCGWDSFNYHSDGDE